MRESRLGHMVDPLRELLAESEEILAGYRKGFGGVIAGTTCDFLPVEPLASAGVMALRIPHPGSGSGCAAKALREDLVRAYDCVVIPDRCAGWGATQGLPVPVHSFHAPSGYGEKHAGALHASIAALLGALGMQQPENWNSEKLKAVTEEYNVLRRGVRGISSLRAAKPDLLSQEDLYAVFAAAVSLPPSVAADHLAPILERMNGTESMYAGKGIPAIVHSCSVSDPQVIDEIEEAGCIVIEDDTCNGRRQFDLSFNVGSADLYAEILDAYSYKPLCPSLRPIDERYELFYKLLKSYGIELVIFLDDKSCSHREDEIGQLRTMLMRQGVDPLVVTPGSAGRDVEEYLARAGM